MRHAYPEGFGSKGKHGLIGIYLILGNELGLVLIKNVFNYMLILYLHGSQTKMRKAGEGLLRKTE